MAADVDASPYLADVAASLDHPAGRCANWRRRYWAKSARRRRWPCDLCAAASRRRKTTCGPSPLFALARIGPAAVPALRLMLQFSDPRTVASAVGALSQIGPAARESLADLEALAPRAPLAVQLACAAAMARIGGDANRGLRCCCGRSTTRTRRYASSRWSASPNWGPAAHAAIPRILECAADPAPEVRAAAALTLAGFARRPPTRSRP